MAPATVVGATELREFNLCYSLSKAYGRGQGLNIFSSNLLAIKCNKFAVGITPSLVRRLSALRLIPDPSINSNGSFWPLSFHMWKLCRGNVDCCLDKIMSTSSGMGALKEQKSIRPFGSQFLCWIRNRGGTLTLIESQTPILDVIKR